MEKLSFAPGVFFLIILAVIVVSYIAGALVQKMKDKPVYIPETSPHDLEQFPHHFHDHDKKKE